MILCLTYCSVKRFRNTKETFRKPLAEVNEYMCKYMYKYV